jgi:deferrochelatase/peroxidase EfeB
VSIEFKPEKLQGNILRGYGRNCVRYVVLEVADRSLARAWLGKAADGGDADIPAVTTEEHWGESKPDLNFNIGITYRGLRALGASAMSLSSFPTEFVEGMESRAVKLGDIGWSAPSEWEAPFEDMSRVHVLATLHADDDKFLDQAQAQIEAAGQGKAFALCGTREGVAFAKPNENYVHFGYRDNISQPRFRDIHDPNRYPDLQPQMPLGTVLLGFPTIYEGIDWKLPYPDALGEMGSFNAFRVLEQDVQGFEKFLDDAATQVLEDPRAEQVLPIGAEKKIGEGLSRHAAMREVIAAKMCGRWRDGTPLQLSPDMPNPDVPLSEFDYDEGGQCPYGSHTRRCNPRGGPIVQRIANNTRRLVRRGTPYGPAYDPAKRDSGEDGPENCGLLGNFMCANLGAQFEAVMCDWINLGLQDPHITGTNDPLIGVNDPDVSYFDIPLPDGDAVRIDRLPRLVNTRGGAYLFQPSLPAIRYIAALRG